LRHQWKYLIARGPFVFVEETIDHGLQLVVFEPNGDPGGTRATLA
jgi:hypothetical protein